MRKYFSATVVLLALCAALAACAAPPPEASQSASGAPQPGSVQARMNGTFGFFGGATRQP
jgi:hypothetical protein